MALKGPQKNLQIPLGLYEQARGIAKEEGRSMRKQLLHMIREGMKRRGVEPED